MLHGFEEEVKSLNLLYLDGIAQIAKLRAEATELRKGKKYVDYVAEHKISLQIKEHQKKLEARYGDQFTIDQSEVRAEGDL